MQAIDIVRKRATFPLAGAMSPILSDSNSPHERVSRGGRRIDRVEKFIPDAMKERGLRSS
jgi:hypothetical protein